MALLRRLFGSGRGDGDRDGGPTAPDSADGGAAPDGGTAPPTAAEVDAEERARELQLLRDEQARLGELVLRQQRYADRSWVPPSQGGTRRSDDDEAKADDR
jgi:hypothetical protein